MHYGVQIRANRQAAMELPAQGRAGRGGPVRATPADIYLQQQVDVRTRAHHAFTACSQPLHQIALTNLTLLTLLSHSCSRRTVMKEPAKPLREKRHGLSGAFTAVG